MEVHPQLRLKFSQTWQILENSGRVICPRCNNPRRYYCYDCILSLTEGIPQVVLPTKFDVIQHAQPNSRITGVQAALIAPHSVKLIRLEGGSSSHRRENMQDIAIQQYNTNNTVILFPLNDNTPVVSKEYLKEVERVIVIDSNWRKARNVLNHPQLKNIRAVQLPADLRTTFWRRGRGDFRGSVEEGLCTIEAIYWTCKSLEPDKNFDDLLWLYTYQQYLVSKQQQLRVNRASGSSYDDTYED